MMRLPQDELAPYLPDARWSYSDAVYVWLAGIVASTVAAFFVIAVDATPIVRLSVALLAQLAGGFALLAWMSSSRGTADWARDFGLHIRPGHIWGLGVGLGLQIVVALVVGPFVEALTPDDAPQQSVVELGEGLDSGFESIVFMFLVVVIAPLFEETIFRGVLLSRLRRSMASWPAILVSAAVFAVIHLIDPNAWPAVPGLFLIGIALGWLALRYGGLSVPIFVHGGVNLTGAVFLLYGDDLVESAESVMRLL